MRASDATTGSATDTTGSTSARRLPSGSTARSRQPTTAQPGASADTPYSSIVASQNDGTVMPTMDSSLIARLAPPERNAAIALPSGIASTTATASASTVSSTVTPAAAAISLSTGRPA